MKLVYDSGVDATVKVSSAAVYAEPNMSSPLIGYVPGATRISIYPYEHKDHWVRADIDWAYEGRTWIKISDIAVGNDYRLYKGDWPLEYVYMTDGEGTDIIWAFPSANHCGTKEAKNLIANISKKLFKPEKKIDCKELWEVPGTSLFLANPQMDRIDIWFSKKTKNIFINSLYGIEIGSIIYGYRNGESKYVFTKCKQGQSIACFLYSGIKPSKISNIKEPIQSFSPYKPRP